MSPREGPCRRWEDAAPEPYTRDWPSASPPELRPPRRGHGHLPPVGSTEVCRGGGRFPPSLWLLGGPGLLRRRNFWGEMPLLFWLFRILVRNKLKTKTKPDHNGERPSRREVAPGSIPVAAGPVLPGPRHACKGAAGAVPPRPGTHRRGSLPTTTTTTRRGGPGPPLSRRRRGPGSLRSGRRRGREAVGRGQRDRREKNPTKTTKPKKKKQRRGGGFIQHRQPENNGPAPAAAPDRARHGPRGCPRPPGGGGRNQLFPKQ